MIKFGNSNIEKIRLGDATISKIYLGANLVYAQPLYRDADWVKLASTLTTSFFPTNNTEVLCDINITSSGVTIYQGNSGSSRTDNFSAYVSSSGNWRFDGKAIAIGGTPYINTWISVKHNKSGIWINGVSQGSYASPNTFTSSTALKIYSPIKIRTFKVYNNNSLVLDFVPKQEISTGYYGLFDKVGNVFYGNANNTGEL